MTDESYKKITDSKRARSKLTLVAGNIKIVVVEISIFTTMIAIATQNACDFRGTSSDRKQELAELKSQIDARDVIGEYVELKGTGETRSGKCPFHEDRKASFVVGHDGYRCMACDEKGDAIEFLQKHLTMSFKDAVADLASRVNMDMPASLGQPDRRTTKSKPRPKPKPEPQLVPIPACPSGEWDKPSIIRIEPIEKTESGKGYGPDGLDFRKVKVGDNLVSVDRHFWYPYKSSKESAAIVRLEYTQDGKREKVFRQLQKIEGQWKYTGKELWEGYREREIIAAIKKTFSEFPNGYGFPADLIPTVLSVEGETCAEAIHQLGLPCLTYRGSASKAEMQESLSRLKSLTSTLIVVHLEDNDEVGARKGKDLIKAGTKVGLPVISIPTARLVDGQLCEKGDVVDVLENMDQQKFINRLEKEIHKAVAERQAQDRAQESQPKSQTPKRGRRGIEWNHNLIAKEIAEKYRGQMAWDVKIQQWRRYSSELEGIWAIEPKEFIRQIIRIEIEPIAEMNRNPKTGKLPNITNNVVSGVENLLKDDLAVRHWNEDNLRLIPFENGVFNLETRELIEHAPGHYLTWCLPYDYNPEAKCDKIRRWMLEMSHGNQTQVDLFRAYLYAIVTARTDWHSYLEMLGPGGTGKSTFINLAIALVGSRNTHATQLKKLEGSRFETACLKDKRLVVITDSENFMGQVSTLKALTGGDSIPYERKFMNSNNGFIPICKVIVAANEPIQSADYTSGLERRRLIVEMTKQIEATKQRNLISFRQGRLDGEFVSEIPGLLNWVLDLEAAKAEKIVKAQLQSQTAAKAKNLIATNPIADWADLNIIYDPEAKTYVGTKVLDSSKYLYASYDDYCQGTNSKVVSLRRYSGLFEDLLKNQLKLGISKHRDKDGNYFQGVKLRFEKSAPDEYGQREIVDTAPDIPLLISGKFDDSSPPDNPPPDIPPPPSPPKGPQPNTTPPQVDTTRGPVTNNREPVINPGPQQNDRLCDGSVTGRVTAGTPGSDGCDGCDGFLSDSVEKEFEVPKVVDSLNVNVVSEEKTVPHASHPSQPFTGKGFEHHQPVTSPITDPSQLDEQPAIDVVQSQQTIEIEASSEPEREQEQMEMALGYIVKDVERLGWTAEQERQFLLSHYQVDDRTKLHFSQMTNLIVVLEGMQPEEPSPETKQFPAQSEDPNRDRLNEILDEELGRIGWTRGMESEELQKKYGVQWRSALTQTDLLDWREAIEKLPTAPLARIKGQTGDHEWVVVRKYYQKGMDCERYDLIPKGSVDERELLPVHCYLAEIIDD